MLRNPPADRGPFNLNPRPSLPNQKLTVPSDDKPGTLEYLEHCDTRCQCCNRRIAAHRQFCPSCWS